MRSLKGVWILMVVSLICLTAPSALAAKKVLILPFHIHADEDLSFLQNGIQDMLATRLAYEDQVVVIGKEAAGPVLAGLPKPIDEPAAVKIGRQLEADFVVLGTLTVFGDSLSTDVRFIEVEKGVAVVTFSQYAKSRGEVLGHVDMFAGQVNEKVFGRKTYTYALAPAPGKEPEADRRKHPESVFFKEGQTMSEAAIWKSARFKTNINGISIGDVDGDGKNEVVFVGDRTVHVYRFTDGVMTKVAEVEGESNHFYIGVDAADINGNGFAEIFVTNILKSNREMSSFVLEWNGGKFVRIVDGENWFYRVLRPPGGNKTLVGQALKGNQMFRKDIQVLAWNGSRYEPAGEKRYLKPVHVHGLMYGNLSKDGREMAIAFSENDNLRILDDANGSEIWLSAERYGGNSLYLEFPDEAAASIGDHREMKHAYLPQRIFLTDIDNDGKIDVLVPTNRDLAGRYLGRLRIYDRGYFQGLVWEEFGLTPRWKTRELPGYISDWVIADLDNDGKNEIVCAVVTRTTLAFGQEKSYIITLALGS